MQTTPLIRTFSDADFEPIEFNNQIHPRIKIHPMYFELGLSPYSQIFGRRAVLNGLLESLDYLPPEYGFLVWDVYRPRAVQSRLFDWMREEVRKKFPELSEQQNYEETRKFVLLPSKVGEEYCAPHLSGGAIDLTLFDISNSVELDMGTPFDDCTERAHSNYFDLKKPLTFEEENIKKNRNILRGAMEKVGFVSYQYEWWHFDMGDILWSQITGCPAAFGALFGDEEWPVDVK